MICSECGATILRCEDCTAPIPLRAVRNGWHVGQCPAHGGQHQKCVCQAQSGPWDVEERDPILKKGGKFRVSRELIENHPRQFLKLMAQVIVMRCEYRYEFNGWLFEGVSDLFAPADEACNWPDYELLCHVGATIDDVTFEAKRVDYATGLALDQSMALAAAPRL